MFKKGFSAMFKKFISLFLFAALTIPMLAGCAVKETVTAESLLEGAYPTQVTSLSENVSIDFDIEFPINEKQTMSTVMSSEMMMDVNSNCLNAEGDIKLSLRGVNQEIFLFMWRDMVNNKEYVKQEDTWIVSDVEGTEKNYSLSNMTLKKEYFTDLVLEPVEANEDYKVKGTVDFKNVVNLTGGVSAQSMENLPESLVNGGITVEVQFDKKTKYVNGIKMFFDSSALNIDETTKVNKFEIEMTNIQYNTNDDLTIPTDVIQNAVDANTDTDIHYDIPLITDDTNVGNVDDTNIVQESSSNTEEYSNVKEIGKYNGQAITEGCDVEIFLSDGWVIDESFSRGYSAWLTNPKYEKTDLLIDSKDVDNDGKVTEADLRASGVWGFSIDHSFSDGELPPIEFANGLKLGSTLEDLENAYGKAKEKNIYEGAYSTNYRYLIDKDVVMSFSIYKETEFLNSGLQTVVYSKRRYFQ